MSEERKNYFEELYAVNVNDVKEKKGRLDYLSWAYAWAEIKKRHPDATYTVYENAAGWNYHTDGRTCWVKTGVTVCGFEHIEYLPVMDSNNRSIAADKVTSYDVNKAIQRSLTKACARHGLGLYIYAGEDLPEAEQGQETSPAPTPAQIPIRCERCGQIIESTQLKSGNTWSAADIIAYAKKRYGKCICTDCMRVINTAKESEDKING